jgi:hypothetical protein
MITYEKYIELVSKRLRNKADVSLPELKQMCDFEAEQPYVCPHCNRTVRSPFQPPRIAHDIAACAESKGLKKLVDGRTIQVRSFFQ